ncbi:MAG: hypothetical protein IJW81_07785 [Clostridia bacterium]|nr:hypothetical protein [Clostridia bacterium]
MKHRHNGEEMRERIVLFILCGLILIGFYIVFGLIALPMMMEILAEWSETGQNDLVNQIIFLLMALLYVIPLYTVYFNQNATYKRFVLQETKDGFDLKSLFRKFMAVHGCWDILLYAVYSLFMPLCYLISEQLVNQYVSFLYVQQAAFYGFPIPKAIAYFLAVAGFVLQYSAVFVFAARRWDKHRLHRD